MVALYNYMSQILVELIKLANLIISMTRAAACANRIQSVFEIRSSMRIRRRRRRTERKGRPRWNFAM